MNQRTQHVNRMKSASLLGERYLDKDAAEGAHGARGLQHLLEEGTRLVQHTAGRLRAALQCQQTVSSRANDAHDVAQGTALRGGSKVSSVACACVHVCAMKACECGIASKSPNKASSKGMHNQQTHTHTPPERRASNSAAAARAARRPALAETVPRR
jgi:hypothetical protein